MNKEKIKKFETIKESIKCPKIIKTLDDKIDKLKNNKIVEK